MSREIKDHLGCNEVEGKWWYCLYKIEHRFESAPDMTYLDSRYAESSTEALFEAGYLNAKNGKAVYEKGVGLLNGRPIGWIEAVHWRCNESINANRARIDAQY